MNSFVVKSELWISLWCLPLIVGREEIFKIWSKSMILSRATRWKRICILMHIGTLGIYQNVLYTIIWYFKIEIMIYQTKNIRMYIKHSECIKHRTTFYPYQYFSKSLCHLYWYQKKSKFLRRRSRKYLNVTFHLSIFSRSTLIYSSSKSEIQANFSGKLDLGDRTAWHLGSPASKEGLKLKGRWVSR